LYAVSVLDWSFYIRWKITLVFKFATGTESGQTLMFNITRIHGRDFNLLADSTGMHLNVMQVLTAVPAITGCMLYYFIRMIAYWQGMALVAALTARLLPAF
jgi:hypothetical protein